MEKICITLIEHYTDENGKSAIKLINRYDAETGQFQYPLFTNGYRPVCVIPADAEKDLLSDPELDAKIADLSYEQVFLAFNRVLARYLIKKGMGW